MKNVHKEAMDRIPERYCDSCKKKDTGSIDCETCDAGVKYMKDVWNSLMEKWAKTSKGKVNKVCYQTPRRVGDRLAHFEKHCVPVLKGMKVLEIGSNAGLFGYCIDKVSSAYIGVEPGILISRKKGKGVDYYKQAQITQKEMSAKARFVNATVQQFSSITTNDYDALVLCFVLYHLTTKEVKLLAEKILPKCKVVIIQNRIQKRPTKHNSYKFYKTNNVRKFFEHYGFKCEVIHSGKFDEIICKKPSFSKFLKEELYDKAPVMTKATEKKGDAAIKKLVVKKAPSKIVEKAVGKAMKRSVKKSLKKVAVKSSVKKKVVKKSAKKKVVNRLNK